MGGASFLPLHFEGGVDGVDGVDSGSVLPGSAEVFPPLDFGLQRFSASLGSQGKRRGPV